jgi:hypothetical protein
MHRLKYPPEPLLLGRPPTNTEKTLETVSECL